MAKIQLNDSKYLSDFGKPYIVAEVNTSHFGDVELAKKMISKAKEVGCDCVKFQSWSVDTLYSKSYYNENPIAKRFVKKFSFAKNELKELSEFCGKNQISFSSTPYSRDEVDFLVELGNVPYLKVASMDLNNYAYLRYIAKYGMPIILSTGMSQMDEIKNAVSVIEQEGNTRLCLLHCVSIYPPEIDTIRLNNILGLRDQFPDYPIGFSDHTLGIEIPSAAIALGACMIEKHFTLDKTKIGMDNQMALEPEEMFQLVEYCNNVHKAIGGKERIVFQAEMEQRKLMRRSVVSSKDLKAGKKLVKSDLDVKRPGTGFIPSKLNDLIGRTLIRDVEKDTLITEQDLKRGK